MSKNGEKAVENIEFAQEVRAALNNVLASSVFSRSPSLSRFLDYVVQRALDPTNGAISAYGIATEALGRREDFDPMTDPVIRVTAGRLRQALDRYYAGEGANDPLRITMPSGGYTPVFERRDIAQCAPKPIADAPAQSVNAPAEAPPADPIGPDARESAAGTPSPRAAHPRKAIFISQIYVPLIASLGTVCASALLLLLYSSLSEPDLEPKSRVDSVIDAPALQSLDAALSDDRTAGIATADAEPVPPAQTPSVFPRLAIQFAKVATPLDWYSPEAAAAALRTVVGRFDEVSLVSRGRGAAANYDLVVEAFGDSAAMQIFLRLESREAGMVVWSDDYTLAPSLPGEPPSLTDFFGRALAPVLSPYGVLLSEFAQSGGQSESARCIDLGYRYFDEETGANRVAAQKCLEKMIRDGVAHPTVYALKAFLHLEGYRRSDPSKFDGSSPLLKAEEAARDALRIAPGSARAHQASFAVNKVEQRHDLALAHATSAREANPYDLDILTDMAAYLASRGMLAEAAPLFEQANAMAYKLPVWYVANYALYRTLLGDRFGAYQSAVSLSPTNSVLLSAAQVIASHEVGDHALRDQAITALLTLEPLFGQEPVDRFLRRGFAQKVAAKLGDKLKRAFMHADIR